jgi:N-acetylglucosaminyldiphosphoundecaprenol N-acetyl-beta-D-mannosaminyltransferase
MDDFDRDVYCLAGLPFDAISLPETVRQVREAAMQSVPCFISTPNLNFLIASQDDPDFRESVCQSDLSLADGMPLVWMAKLLGLPIFERVAGSDLFATLGEQVGSSGKKLSVFFFGGMEGVAERACEALNAQSSGFSCVGFEYPGIGVVADMSSAETIKRINASGADFLVVSLGARKGQAWIMHNRQRISVPLISHLGAVVNFAAGTVRRAPRWMRRFGLEWLWRIKEEPALWRRYWGDGLGFMGLLLMRILPYAIWLQFNWLRFNKGRRSAAPKVEFSSGPLGLSINLSNALCSGRLEEVRIAFRRASSLSENVKLNLERVTYLDSAFLGLILMLRKQLRAGGHAVLICNVPPGLRKVFYWCGAEYLLAKA